MFTTEAAREGDEGAVTRVRRTGHPTCGAASRIETSVCADLGVADAAGDTRALGVADVAADSGWPTTGGGRLTRVLGGRLGAVLIHVALRTAMGTIHRPPGAEGP